MEVDSTGDTASAINMAGGGEVERHKDAAHVG
jgi:hypothetical protein